MNKIASGQRLEELLVKIISGFTRHNEALRVTRAETPFAITLTITAHADDTPKIIGQSGAMIQAIKLLMFMAGERMECAVRVVLEEPAIGKKEAQMPFRPSPQWTPDGVRALLKVLMPALFQYDCEWAFIEAGEDTVVIKITLDGGEPNFTAETVDALGRVLNATGKSTGRKLLLEMTPR